MAEAGVEPDLSDYWAYCNPVGRDGQCELREERKFWQRRLARAIW